ncbi:hypothetical protein [Glycomyces sp. YM15]|uniref:hypothetical protein n=1 Tax=Glycomyces sp. YM15 TaxID=2800446 RepID=UPI0019630DF8|nr:hypothetical protein [Glycomyces sp. YM15]
MSKGFRVFLHLLQALSLLGALWYLYFSFRNAYDGMGLSDGENQHINTWIIGLGILSIALSPQLWSSARSKNPYTAMDEDRARGDAAPPGRYEPMQTNQAPAPPASSYSQPSAPRADSYGQPSGGGITPTSSPQAGSPWNFGR